MRTWLLAILVIAAALSGCAGDAKDVLDDTDYHVDDHDDHDHGHDDGNHDEVANNTAPVASLEADLLNGTAPFPVNLTLDGSDADGDDLEWSLQHNGTEAAAGEQLPATLSIDLTVGDHTFVLTVSDGQAEATAELVITVVAGSPALEPIFKVLEIVEGCYLCIDAELATGEPMGAAGCAGWNLEENELDCGWVTVPAEYQGLPYSVFSFTSGTLFPYGDDGHPDVEFYDTCSPEATLIEQHFDQEGDTVIGLIPEGAGCIVAFEFHWPNVGHTIEFSLGAIAHA